MPSPQPTWWKDGVCYQIWPSSYKDSNSDGLGDIPGILPTLNYLRDLGIDIIWLSPTYASPQADMGYDISDFEAIYPPFGTMADMDMLITEVHRRGMRIILDLVINHTSDQHVWFKESRKSRDNKYSDFYMWQPPKYAPDGTRRPPNNWRSSFGGSAWEYVPERDQYYLHLFAKEQPDLNWENPVARKAIYETAIEYWLKKGVDGFRVDVANLYSKDVSFPDAKILEPDTETQFPFEHCLNGPRIHEFLKEIRRDVLDKYGEDVMMVGECWMTERDEVIRYVSKGEKELNMIFDFAMASVVMEFEDGAPKTREWKLPELKAAVAKAQLLTQDTEAWTTVFAENHDVPRSLSRYATTDPKWRVKAGKLLAVMLATLTGTLFLYQGQEIGMVNVPDSWTVEDFRDIASLNSWKATAERYAEDEEKLCKALQMLRTTSRDNARTPVQWDDGPNAGFCPQGVKPWIRVHDNYKEVNVAAAQKDPDSILATWKQMLRLRKQYRDVLVYGSFEIYNMEDPNVFSYVKSFEDTKILVALNFGSEEQDLEIPPSFKERTMELLVANVDQVQDELSAWEARAYLAR
jgi:oligo-1,6-glucosidase